MLAGRCAAQQQEWVNVPESGTRRAVEIALYQSQLGFACDGRCALTYYGKPARIVVHKDGRGKIWIWLYCSRCEHQAPREDE